jgi:hypothetical protein
LPTNPTISKALKVRVNILVREEDKQKMISKNFNGI